MVPKFTSIASTRWCRSCLYALLGSSPCSLSGATVFVGVPLPLVHPKPTSFSREKDVPTAPPSPYHRGVVQPTARQTAISCVTMPSLWLAALRGVRFPLATLSG